MVIIYSRDILIIGFAIFGVLLALEGYLAAKFYNGVILRLISFLMLVDGVFLWSRGRSQSNLMSNYEFL